MIHSDNSEQKVEYLLQHQAFFEERNPVIPHGRDLLDSSNNVVLSVSESIKDYIKQQFSTLDHKAQNKVNSSLKKLKK